MWRLQGFCCNWRGRLSRTTTICVFRGLTVTCCSQLFPPVNRLLVSIPPPFDRFDYVCALQPCQSITLNSKSTHPMPQFCLPILLLQFVIPPPLQVLSTSSISMLSYCMSNYAVSWLRSHASLAILQCTDFRHVLQRLLRLIVDLM